MEVPDPLPLRTIAVPAEVTAVDGCNCSGREFHRVDCTIQAVPYAEAMAAIDAANARLRAWTAALNARFHQGA